MAYHPSVSQMMNEFIQTPRLVIPNFLDLEDKT